MELTIRDSRASTQTAPEYLQQLPARYASAGGRRWNCSDAPMAAARPLTSSTTLLLRVTGYRVQATSYQLQGASYKLQATSCTLHITRGPQPL